jgi:hypothetical protein
VTRRVAAGPLGVLLCAVAIYLLHRGAVTEALAAVALAAALVSVAFPRGHAPLVALSALVVECAAVGRAVGRPERAGVTVALAVAVWLLHNAFALTAATHPVRQLPRDVACTFAVRSGRVLLAALPVLVAAGLLALLPRATGGLGAAVQVAGLLAAGALCVLPARVARTAEDQPAAVDVAPVLRRRGARAGRTTRR